MAEKMPKKKIFIVDDRKIVVEGLSDRMNVSVKTVNTYCRRIREKLEAESLNEPIELSNHWFRTNS